MGGFSFKPNPSKIITGQHGGFGLMIIMHRKDIVILDRDGLPLGDGFIHVVGASAYNAHLGTQIRLTGNCRAGGGAGNPSETNFPHVRLPSSLA